ncbi:MAG TPA: EVE domain-containing protein [Syntrophomonas sp.]|jgi:predicted RNA-binding protein with PUA-like domain|nr:EVE domain-containing protein [Syntrophomonas sp.]
MAYWLLKTEPDEYSWSDLIREKEAVWDGVKAPQALANIKKMLPGDLAFIYHTGRERAIVGTAEIVSSSYMDANTKGLVFKVAPVKELARKVMLAEVKASRRFDNWDLIRLPRLSVVPVTPEQWGQIVNWE